jgi:ATP synthase F1 complex assembly factor 2
MKRFWKTVGLSHIPNEKAYAIMLDHRALKTPSGNKLRVPEQKSILATLVAKEWEDQETLLKPHALPVVS